MKLVPYLSVALVAALASAPLPEERELAREAAPRRAQPEIAYDLARTGIDWTRGLDAALHRGKPVLLFQLLGDFATVHC